MIPRLMLRRLKEVQEDAAHMAKIYIELEEMDRHELFKDFSEVLESVIKKFGEEME